jgi:class 3 adenylate cyclase/tetratricopeptide (TPR) repeat protein
MVCSNCGATNAAGAKFCNDCGTRMALECADCGTVNPSGAKFCSECASPLGGAAPAADRPGTGLPARSATGAPVSTPAPVAERRVVSVLFADLVGFTTFAEGRDAEDVRETLSRYFEIAREVVERYGGTVEKFIGDAVMAVWGAPVAREDDAELAVRAGMELVDAVRVLGEGIQARAGVLTGEAAVTLGATNQGMVAGDLVNTASRLQSAAAPGTVLVGEATQRAASLAIVFEPAGEQTMKGKAAPVAAWRALRVVAERGGRGRSDTLEAPFVGRDEELRMLKDLYHSTSRERRTRLVSLVGPAGIGKSRLAWEFLKYIDGLLENVWWHAGRSPAYGSGLSFWALGEMVRGRCELLETDDERTTRAKVSETLAKFVPDEDERRWIEPALLTLLGVEAGSSSPAELFAAWRTFFERLAATGTVVMVFEDLHWADSGLLDFIDHLMEWSRTLPIYIVTLARPELLETRTDWGAGKRHFTSIFLEPLTEPMMRALLAGLVPGLPEAAMRAIVGRADGIPLYAVETVRMLVADGRLTEQNGVYVPAGDLSSLAVPETLTALIAARLDGLDPIDRSLIQEGSVLGQSFTLVGLTTLSGMSAAELEPRLRALVRRELLVLEADPRSPERGQYAFVQSLIREVAYNTLARRDRKAKHLAAARWFETLDNEELAGALARHYLAAHENAPAGAEADALAAQARIALRAAAERATTLGAQDQAVAFLEQALTVTTDEDERAELLARAGTAASAGGRHDAADGFLTRALEYQRASGDRHAEARAIAALGHAMLEGRRTDRALALLEPASEAFADMRSDPDVIRLEGQLARAYFFDNQDRLAIEVSDRVLEAAERADLVAVIADTLVTRGTSLGNLGRMYEGIGVIRAGEDLAEARGISAVVLRARINRSAMQGTADPQAAGEVARSGLALARRLGLRSAASLLVGNAASQAIRTGDWDWAVSELEAALNEDLEPTDRMNVLQNIFTYRMARGAPADELLAELEGLAAQSSDPDVEANVVLSRAEAAFFHGRPLEAQVIWLELALRYPFVAPTMFAAACRAALWGGDIAAARVALAGLDGTGVHGSAIEATRVGFRAGIAALEGRASEAMGMYREALRAWRDLQVSFEEALTAMDMAILLDVADAEVAEAARSAHEILGRLGAVTLLEQLDAAMAKGEPAPAKA